MVNRAEDCGTMALVAPRRRSPAEFKDALWFAGNSPDMN
jgi:hypothetical protein